MCPDCIRLKAEYERLVSALAAATQGLHSGAKTVLPPQESRRLAVTAKDAWVNSERARLEIENHRELHRDILWQ